MPTISYILQKPYKEGVTKELKQRKAEGKNIDSLLNPDETRVYMFVTIDRNHRAKLKTEYTIYPKKWDFTKQLLKSQIAGSTEFNKRLLTLKTTILNRYHKILDEKPGLSFEQVKNDLRAYLNGKELPTLKGEKSPFNHFDNFIEHLQNDFSELTIKKHISTKNSLSKFCEKNNEYKNLVFSQVDHAFKDRFVKHLREQKPRGRQKTRPKNMQTGLLNETVGKYLSSLKTFMQWAYKRGLHENMDFNDFSLSGLKRKRKVSSQKNNIITLSINELQRIYNYDFTDNKRLERVRDIFCFGTYTGQRWSDVERFNKNDIQNDIWGFESYKTKKFIELDLIGFAAPALEILKKYSYELPKISSQKFNDYLKEVGKVCEIDTLVKLRRYMGAKEIEIEKPKYEFMSSHMARRTCVSILLNVYNLATSHVMQITGHSDLKTLQKYLDTDREARRKAMAGTTIPFEIKTNTGTY